MSTVIRHRQAVRGLNVDMQDMPKQLDSIERRIMRTRKQMGMTQLQLSKAIQTGESYMQRIENGMHTPSIKMLRAIAIELDVSIDYLCCLTDRKDMNYD
jgi:transcriptional regulator with XRE-family HTH domain